jgi:galactose oxidase-like protein
VGSNIGSRLRAVATIALVLSTACTASGRGSGVIATTEPPPSAAPSAAGPAFGLSLARPMGVARAAHTATRLRDGRVLLAGGFDDQEGSTASAELFDPRTGTSTPTGSMSVPRVSHTATLLEDGRVLIAGGFDVGGERLSTAELYEPESGRFTTTGSMPSPRADHTATLLPSGWVLIAGGTGPAYAFLSSALLYDPRTGTFGTTGSMSVPRESHTATLLRDGRVLIAGGHVGRQEDIRIHASAEVYEPSAHRFAAVGDMTIARHKHDAVLLRDGRVLIVGGSVERDDLGLYRSTEIFDPATGAFHPSARLSDGRYKMRGTSVLLADGRVVVCCGGVRAEVFDPSSGSFRAVPGSFGDGPLFGAAARIGPEEILVTGGYSLSGPATNVSWIIRLPLAPRGITASGPSLRVLAPGPEDLRCSRARRAPQPSHRPASAGHAVHRSLKPDASRRGRSPVPARPLPYPPSARSPGNQHAPTRGPWGRPRP